MSSTGPDLVCIGMEKAGTGWLHDQLMHAEGAWATPVKELNYFCGDPFTGFNLRRLAELAKRPGLSERDHAFLRAFAAGRAAGKSERWYRSLFVAGDGLLTADVSPNYAMATPAEIAGAVRQFPRARYVLLLRHPVRRLWSALCMRVRKSQLAASDLQDPARVVALAELPEHRERSYATHIAVKWSAALPDGALRHWFLEDIAERPAAVRDEILAFAGLPGAAVAIAPDYNRKENQWKLPLPPAVEARLHEHFAAEITACAERFGGRALAWQAARDQAGEPDMRARA